MKNKMLLLMSALVMTMSGCGSSSAPTATATSAEQVPWEKPAPKASCGPDDVVEPGLQGQVTLMERLAGFKGTHCNLEQVGQWPGQGAGVSHAALGPCAYFSQAATLLPLPIELRPGLQNKGVVVLDVSDSSHPVVTDYLSSISFVDPWESMKLNEKRKLLAAVNGLGNSGGPEFDVYDLSQDCAHPKLLASVALSNASLKGHEGNWAPDGMTYYGGDLTNNIYYAIDVKDPTAPKLIAEWSPPDGRATHGLSVSTDGNRGYFTRSVSFAPGASAAPENGFFVLDISEIQSRKENPQVKVLATEKWRDGAAAQHTIPVFIKGHPYLIHVDELGSGGVGLGGLGDSWVSACAQNLPPFGFARIYDLADETQPRLVSKVMLEVHDPANCADVLLDNVGQQLFGYDTHQCSVDDKNEASILVCAQFSSGLRVYDIRDPHRPREIAYYNPPANPGYKPGSGYNLTGVCGTTDWVPSMPVFKKESGEIWFTATCNGFQVVKFSNDVWPLK